MGGLCIISIYNFFSDMSSFSDEEFRKIFGYVDPNQLELETKERELVKTVMQKNIAEMRRAFDQIKKFSETHHPIFRRFKHAGAPLVLGAEANEQDEVFSNFDSYTLVPVGKGSLADTVPIPLSNDVLRGYDIVIEAVQMCLEDLVTNRLECIKRNTTGILPTEYYFLERLPEEEIQIYTNIVEEFYNKHSYPNNLKHFKYNTKLNPEKIKWYIDLPNFLKECKDRGEASRKSF